MQISCVHCGQPLTITATQLGGRSQCPHCGNEIQLPRAERPAAETAHETTRPRRWLESSFSGLVSVVFHTALVLVLALVSYGGRGVAGDGEEVLIGELPYEELSQSGEEQLSVEEPEPQAAEQLDEMLEVTPPADSSGGDFSADLLASEALSPSGGEGPGFEFDVNLSGSGSGSGGSWEGLLQNLRRNGLDIVIAFDSTGSMGGEIRQVKAQIARIGSTLITMVPKARISVCTYRDQGDAYVVRGLPLTGDIEQVVYFLNGVRADGGGDHPEAVQDGLRWAVRKNEFRPRARKVILLFGDAPPHPQDLTTCLRIASDFQGQQDGLVSTVTCRSLRRLPEFVEIAELGGGEAFMTTDEREIMTQLIVLVFGSRHRSKVLEAFRLLER